ncbi:MAG: alpha/beta hydrolase [Pseudomonadales bacterium]|nr:alpha/beta hydrolase [Pseudomonadales bacterium]
MKSYQQYNHWQQYQRFFPPAFQITSETAPEEQYWSWQGSNIHLDIGRTQPGNEKQLRLVLLHGAGGHGRLLAPLAKGLNRQGYETVALDLPGYGLTEAQANHIRYDQWIECCVDFILEQYQKDQRPCAIIGLSIGGMLAYYVAAKIQRLALPYEPVAGVVVSTLCDPRYPDVKKQFAKFSWMLRSLPLLDRLPHWLKQQRFPIRWVSRMDTISNDKELSDLVMKDTLGGGTSAPLNFMLSIFNTCPAIEPEDFNLCPVLLVHPEQDRMTPLPLSEKFYRRLRGNKQWVVLKGCGHIPIEEPGIVDMEKSTLRFLSQLKVNDAKVGYS